MGPDNEIDYPVIFFDGVCNLCNASVTFIIKRDKRKRFKFASLQGDYASKTLPAKFTEEGNLPSLVLRDGQIKTKSTAALTIAKNLNGLWPVLYALIIIPAFIRHFVYDLIAQNRYRWFGKKEFCMIPTAELKDRFLD